MHVIETEQPLVTETASGTELRWVGLDQRRRDLEIVAVISERDGAVLVIHVMPTQYRRR